MIDNFYEEYKQKTINGDILAPSPFIFIYIIACSIVIVLGELILKHFMVPHYIQIIIYIAYLILIIGGMFFSIIKRSKFLNEHLNHKNIVSFFKQRNNGAFERYDLKITKKLLLKHKINTLAKFDELKRCNKSHIKKDISFSDYIFKVAGGAGALILPIILTNPDIIKNRLFIQIISLLFLILAISILLCIVIYIIVDTFHISFTDNELRKALDKDLKKLRIEFIKD